MDGNNKFFKSTEEIVSMFLGLIIVLIAGALIYNYFQRQGGNVEVPGVSVSPTPTTIALTTPVGTNTTQEIVTKPAETLKVEGANTGEYVVKKGDSLWKIAQATYGSGYNWVDISKANNIKNPGQLVIGQKINLPKEVIKIAPKSTIETEKYTVVKGDSLSKIALRAYGDRYAWVKIFSANRSLVTNPNIIRPGWVLTIPR